MVNIYQEPEQIPVAPLNVADSLGLIPLEGQCNKD